jgi:hypothetical protein
LNCHFSYRLQIIRRGLRSVRNHLIAEAPRSAMFAGPRYELYVNE